MIEELRKTILANIDKVKAAVHEGVQDVTKHSALVTDEIKARLDILLDDEKWKSFISAKEEVAFVRRRITELEKELAESKESESKWRFHFKLKNDAYEAAEKRIVILTDSRARVISVLNEAENRGYLKDKVTGSMDGFQDKVAEALK